MLGEHRFVSEVLAQRWARKHPQWCADAPSDAHADAGVLTRERGARQEAGVLAKEDIGEEGLAATHA
jgi:hypothetical protein